MPLLCEKWHIALHVQYQFTSTSVCVCVWLIQCSAIMSMIYCTLCHNLVMQEDWVFGINKNGIANPAVFIFLFMYYFCSWSNIIIPKSVHWHDVSLLYSHFNEAYIWCHLNKELENDLLYQNIGCKYNFSGRSNTSRWHNVLILKCLPFFF